jgi:hypothetical protein
MPWVWFEPTIPLIERAKTFHTLDRAATVIGKIGITDQINIHLRPRNLSTSTSRVFFFLKVNHKQHRLFGTIATKTRKLTNNSSAASTCPHVTIQPLNRFSWNVIIDSFINFVYILHFWIKSDNNGQFTSRPTYVSARVWSITRLVFIGGKTFRKKTAFYIYLSVDYLTTLLLVETI